MKAGPPSLLLLALLVPPAYGHHAPALYDNDRLMRVEGHVVDLNFRFPHSILLVDASDGERWAVSLAPPDVSERQGKREALLAIEAGEPITVFGWPHRIREFEIRSHKLKLADGAVIEGAVNTLFEPQVQKDLKRMLQNTQALADFESQNPARELAQWIKTNKPLMRLALEIHRERAVFIGVGNGFPGIKPHLACLATRFPAERFDLNDLPGSAEAYIRKHNEWLARYREGQLYICENAE